MRFYGDAAAEQRVRLMLTSALMLSLQLLPFFEYLWLP